MSDHDFNRPYVERSAMTRTETLDRTTADQYGPVALATALSNLEYQLRWQRLNATRAMKPPPGARQVLAGYLVVRNLGRADEYETWMPDHVFVDLYKPLDPA